jgi:hypothetical protein
MIRRLLAVVVAMLAVTAAAAVVGFVLARRQFSTWGIEPAEAERALPGDELVPEPTMSDTRGITVNAPPEAVWPWLVQLGFGRGGWYSYDQLDMKGRSADEIRPELQSLAVGDLVPTDPNGGFEVRILEPNRALVLMVDTDIAKRRWGASAPEAGSGARGLEASGKFMQTAMPPDFAVSWAIVLEPLDGGRTRLVERVRGRFGTPTAGSRAFGPAMGFGVFVMTRRQMLGIAQRAERTPRPAASSATDPSPGNGHAADLIEAVGSPS